MTSGSRVSGFRALVLKGVPGLGLQGLVAQ